MGVKGKACHTCVIYVCICTYTYVCVCNCMLCMYVCRPVARISQGGGVLFGGKWTLSLGGGSSDPQTPPPRLRACVCMYVCMYVCTYVRLFVCVCMYHVCMLCMYVCMCVCMYVCIIDGYNILSIDACMDGRTDACMDGWMDGRTNTHMTSWVDLWWLNNLLPSKIKKSRLTGKISRVVGIPCEMLAPTDLGIWRHAIVDGVVPRWTSGGVTTTGQGCVYYSVMINNQLSDLTIPRTPTPLYGTSVPCPSHQGKYSHDEIQVTWLL